ncbi:MAG: DUF1648 domain-containing protein [Ferruginibacter sp.]
MQPIPKIKPPLSPFDNTLELISILLLVLMWGFTIFSLFNLPATIPIHFNTKGEADNYGNKITILILPVLGTLIYFGLTQLNKYPHIFNYMTKINEDNALKQYSIATKMLRFLKAAILLIFSLIILFTYLTTIGVKNGLIPWFLPFTLAFLLTPTIMSISQSFRKKIM